MRIKYGSWSLEASPEWEVTKDPECLTLTLSDDGGALQLSSAQKEHGDVIGADIQWCVEQLQGQWSSPIAAHAGDFSGLSVFGTIDGSSWHWWILGHGSILLRASYNGPPSAAPVELPHVNSMLATLAAA